MRTLKITIYGNNVSDVEALRAVEQVVCAGKFCANVCSDKEYYPWETTATNGLTVLSDHDGFTFKVNKEK